jgi:hypothetical protein
MILLELLECVSHFSLKDAPDIAKVVRIQKLGILMAEKNLLLIH